MMAKIKNHCAKKGVRYFDRVDLKRNLHLGLLLEAKIFLKCYSDRGFWIYLIEVLTK